MCNPHIFSTKKATVQHFKYMMSKDNRWAIRGLLKIYSLQTEEEKSIYATKANNGVGFTSADAEILSGFAKQYNSKQWLSEKQMDILKKRIIKYAEQLYNTISKQTIEPKD